MLIYTNATAFVRALRKTIERIPVAIDAAMDQVRTEGVALLSATSSFKNRTGDLRKSFAEFHAGRGSLPFSRMLGSSIHYARFLEWGTERITSRRFLADARTELEGQFRERMVRALKAAL